MGVNKVKYGENVVLDISSDTVTADKLLQGYTAHDNTGTLITGTATGGGTEAISVVDTEDTHGGTIRTITALDISDTTAVASDVAQGKYFYTADGTKTAGTSSGGGGGGKWVRPSDWPDLSKMDVSGGDILYMTSYADEGRGVCSFYVSCTGSYTVEVGTISGATFTSESTHTYSSNSNCNLYYGSANGTYKVLRVTGTAISKLYFRREAVTIGTFHGYSSNQGIIDIVGKLPSSTGKALDCQNQYNLVNVEISDITLSGNCSNMFSGCYSLASLDVSGFDTSGVTSMSNMFNNCASLTSLDVSGFDTSRVTSMSSMFSGCNSLASLDVSGFNTSGVTGMSSMFNNCYSLTSLDVSGFDTSGVTSMSNMFNNCYSLTSLDVSGFDTSGVTNMSSMFSYCASLTSLDVSDFDTSGVTSMGSMFYYCYSLTSLDVSGWDFTKVTTASSTQSMFCGCYGLRDPLTLPATMTMIGNSCFAYTRSIYEYHFLATTPPTLNSTTAFNNMTDFGGKKIYVPSASLEAYQTAANWSTFASYMVGE